MLDRLKELIKVNGYQVAPAELEALLVQHDGVADAAVVGRPDPPRARFPSRSSSTVRSTPTSSVGGSRSGDAVQAAGGVHLVDALPRTPSGKLLRRRLASAPSVETIRSFS